MSKADNDFSVALEGKNIPILTLDEKWHLLFTEMEKTDEIEDLERQLNILVKQEAAIHDECKKIKVLKKKLLGDIVPLRDKVMRTGDKKTEHQLQETKKCVRSEFSAPRKIWMNTGNLRSLHVNSVRPISQRARPN